jgi:hypothetical protein
VPLLLIFLAQQSVKKTSSWRRVGWSGMGRLPKVTFLIMVFGRPRNLVTWFMGYSVFIFSASCEAKMGCMDELAWDSMDMNSLRVFGILRLNGWILHF